jgi:hypothetical protein
MAVLGVRRPCRRFRRGNRSSVPKVVRLGTHSPTMPLDEKTAFGSILLKELETAGLFARQESVVGCARAAAGDVRKGP